MMKLFLLGGFRGIVANYLWLRAEENKRDHDWDRLKTNVDLITKLQPHFLSIWTFQGWNLAYNVSVEWDAPEDKYDWIKQGIKFVQQGVEQQPPLARPDLGHRLVSTTTSSASPTSRSSSAASSATTRTRTSRPTATPRRASTSSSNDNFQLGYGWFSRAVDLVDEGASRLTEGTAEDDPARSSTSTRRPSARGGPTTSPSARCPPTPRPTTPRPSRR